MTDDIEKSHQDVLNRAARIGAVLEQAGIEHDLESVAALCFLAAIGARRGKATELAWRQLAKASWDESARGKWDVTP